MKVQAAKPPKGSQNKRFGCLGGIRPNPLPPLFGHRRLCQQAGLEGRQSRMTEAAHSQIHGKGIGEEDVHRSGKHNFPEFPQPTWDRGDLAPWARGKLVVYRAGTVLPFQSHLPLCGIMYLLF